MRFALVNAKIHNAEPGEPWLQDKALVIQGGLIEAIVDIEATPSDITQRLDLQGQYLLPGLIDTQVNGGGGVLLNDTPSIEGLRCIAEAHQRYGSTAMLPTLISDSLDKMRTAIDAVDAAIVQGVPGIVGIHLEGPFLNAERKGVHDERQFRVIDEEAIELLCSLKHGVTLVTLAPERTSPDVIRRLSEAGVVVAAGHSAANYQQTRAALDNGLTSFTHLFNAMTPMNSREPGVVGAALEDRSSWCGVIVDGYHVHDASLKVALAAKQKGKVVLVTDAMPTVGMVEKKFILNGEEITAENGRCATAEGRLAGSDLDMISALKNTVERLGVSFDEAVRMASLYPAQMIGLDHERGSISVGKYADLIAVDQNFAVTRSWVAGS